MIKSMTGWELNPYRLQSISNFLLALRSTLTGSVKQYRSYLITMNTVLVFNKITF